MKQTKIIKELEFQLGDLQHSNKKNLDLIEEQKMELAIRTNENVEELKLKNL